MATLEKQTLWDTTACGWLAACCTSWPTAVSEFYTRLTCGTKLKSGNESFAFISFRSLLQFLLSLALSSDRLGGEKFEQGGRELAGARLSITRSGFQSRKVTGWDSYYYQLLLPALHSYQPENLLLAACGSPDSMLERSAEVRVQGQC